jgi:hypothetical protein
MFSAALEKVGQWMACFSFIPQNKTPATAEKD